MTNATRIRSQLIRFRVPLICLGLITLVLVVYGQTLGHGFLNYDDDRFVTENIHVIKGLSWNAVHWAFTAGTEWGPQDTDYWRPVSQLSHLLDVSFFGLNPSGSHALNVVLHSLNTLLLFFVLRSMSGSLIRSVLVAVVFAIHPLHVESVAWISERKDLLSGLFFFLTLAAYTRYVRRTSPPFPWGSYFLTLFLFALGLMSKPMLVTLPLILLLLDIWPLVRLRSGLGAITIIVEKIPFFMLSLGSTFITMHGPGGVNQKVMDALPFGWRLANATVAYCIYLRQSLWPSGLSVFYKHPGKDISISVLVISFLVISAVSALVITSMRKRYLMVGWFWYLLMLLPVIGLLQSGEQAHADRYTYLPQVGLSIALFWWLGDLYQKRPGWRFLIVFITCASLLTLMIAAIRQCALWKKNQTLWNHAIECTKGNFIAHNAMASIALESKDYRGAELQSRAALEIVPDFVNAMINLADALAGQGRDDESKTALSVLLQSDRHTSRGWGPIKDAQAKKLRIRLGLALLKFGDRAGAFDEFSRLYIQPPPSGYICLDLAELLTTKTHRDQDAVLLLNEALRLDPGNTAAQNNLAWLLVTTRLDGLRDPERALRLARQANETTGGENPTVLETLAAAQAGIGDFKGALLMATRAYGLAKTAENNELLKRLGKSIENYEEILGSSNSSKVERTGKQFFSP